MAPWSADQPFGLQGLTSLLVEDYQLIVRLNIATMTTIENKVEEYWALENIQRSKHPELKFYLFHAPAVDLLHWTAAERLAPGEKQSTQPELNKKKLRRIEDHLNAPFANTIASSVVVVFNDKSTSFARSSSESSGIESCGGKLTVSWSPKVPAATIVDGRHRVVGASRIENGSLHLNVVGIVGADQIEGAFQYLVINNNSSRVSPDYASALFSDYRSEDLLKRLLASGSTNSDLERMIARSRLDRGTGNPFYE
jgi:DGQHR domain-containing protein